MADTKAFGLEGDYTLEEIAEAIRDLEGLPPEVLADFVIDLTAVAPEVRVHLQLQYPAWFPNGRFFWSDPGPSHDHESGL